MTEQNHLCRVWDIIEKVGVCMLTTQFAGGLRARPIETRIDRDAGLIFFVTDVHSAKHDEIDTAPNVGLVFIDPKDKAYLSITGRARVIRDVAKTEMVWRKTDEVWWRFVKNFAIGSAVVCTGIGSSIDSDHRTASCVLMRSVTSMAPGAWVMANEGFAAAITACGVTPQAQNTGSSSLAIATASP